MLIAGRLFGAARPFPVYERIVQRQCHTPELKLRLRTRKKILAVNTTQKLGTSCHFYTTENLAT